MSQATHPVSKKIAVVFDFDDTLVPDTYDELLKSLGLDPAQFRDERYEVLKASGWDSIPARFYSLVDVSKRRTAEEGKLTRDYIARFGQQLEPFDGVTEMFGRLQQTARGLDPDIVVEFYLITSGFVEVARHTKIAKHFKAMWGCEFHYSETGEVEFLKRSLSHAEKTRYLYYLSKGIGDRSDRDLLFVYEDVSPEELAIPLSQVIYVGDGTSDIPCFAMLNKEDGTAIGVYKEGTAQDWASNYQPTEGERVINLAPADYSENSELMKSLTLAVESACKKIQIQRLSNNE